MKELLEKEVTRQELIQESEEYNRIKELIKKDLELKYRKILSGENPSLDIQIDLLTQQALQAPKAIISDTQDTANSKPSEQHNRLNEIQEEQKIQNTDQEEEKKIEDLPLHINPMTENKNEINMQIDSHNHIFPATQITKNNNNANNK